MSLLLAFTSCQSQDFSDNNDDDEETLETKTLLVAQSITVSQAQEKFQNAPGSNVIVKGYIVGVIEGTSSSKAVFCSPFNQETNILISDNKWENNVEKCIPIRLVSGSKYRTALNLSTHPDNYHKLILVQGNLEKYFSQCGIKTIQAFAFANDSTNSDTTSGQYPIVPFKN